MLKNNVMEHLHLTNCSLSTYLIMKICNRARKAKSLQAIHFSGNPGVNPYLLERIHLVLEKGFEPTAAMRANTKKDSALKAADPV